MAKRERIIICEDCHTPVQVGMNQQIKRCRPCQEVRVKALQAVWRKSNPEKVNPPKNQIKKCHGCGCHIAKGEQLCEYCRNQKRETRLRIKNKDAKAPDLTPPCQIEYDAMWDGLVKLIPSLEGESAFVLVPHRGVGSPFERLLQLTGQNIGGVHKKATIQRKEKA